jgi:gluconokinase
VVFVHLAGDRDLIALRMENRADHFMPLALLDSQFLDLEPPQMDERAIHVDIKDEPEMLINEVLKQFAVLL